MSRQPRVVIPDVPMHIVQRGNNRMHIFLNDEDFALARLILEETSQKHKCAIHAYVLMGNHLHLLLTPNDTRGPSRMMQSMGIRYARYFNRQNDRTGTLWQGRFLSSLIQTDRYFFNCCRYIEMNPVRAGLAMQPADYPWSSFAGNALGAADSMLSSNDLLCSLGHARADRLAAYRELFAHSVEPDADDMIRKATNAGVAIGDAAFQGKLEKKLKRRMSFASHGGDRRSPAYQSLRKSVARSSALTP